MNKTSSIWGVGPKLVISTFVYLALMAGLQHLHPLPIGINMQALHVISGILITAGTIIWIIAARTVVKMRAAGGLYRKGLFAFCRHPLYGNFILLLVPGFCLLANSWPVFTTPVFMYIAFRYFIREEEAELIRIFGQAYLDYKKEVPAIFPGL